MACCSQLFTAVAVACACVSAKLLPAMKRFVSLLLIALLAVVAATAGFYIARSLRPHTDTLPAVLRPASVVGRLAPQLSVKGLEGQSIELASFRGKAVLLNFWASWCGPCVDEMPVLDQFAREHGDEIVVIGVAVEDESDARAFLARKPVSYLIGIGSPASPDESARFGNHLNVLPYSVLIDPQGVVRRAEARSFDAEELNEWVRWQ